MYETDEENRKSEESRKDELLATSLSIASSGPEQSVAKKERFGVFWQMDQFAERWSLKEGSRSALVRR